MAANTRVVDVPATKAFARVLTLVGQSALDIGFYFLWWNIGIHCSGIGNGASAEVNKAAE
jgi:hypothetical protein